jgi:predicted permease
MGVLVNQITADVRYALRAFARTPAFTLTALLTLGIGTAGLTTVYALINGVLLRPLPVERPQELFTLEAHRDNGSSMVSFSYPQYRMLHDAAAPVSLAAYSFEHMALRAGAAEPEMMMGYVVTPEYFRVLGLQPAAGRFFAEADEEQGVVVSHAYWQSRLGGTTAAVGSTVQVNGQRLTVIGVAPEGYTGTLPIAQASFWAPVQLMPVLRPGSDIYTPGRYSWLTLLARTAPGASAAQAQTALTAHVQALNAAGAEFQPARTRQPPVERVTLSALRPIPHQAVASVFGFLGMLLAAALLVLMIAAVNITSMMLARSASRAKELAVRRSLGASRRRLVLQLMTENVLLFAGGAGIGLLMASWLTSLVPLLAAGLPVPLHFDLSLDWRVIAFGVGVGVTAGILFGLAPALHGTAAATMPILREGTSAQRGMRLRSAFVAAQLALTLVLLTSGGLLGRALQKALQLDPGFDASDVAFAEFDLTPFGYDNASAVVFFEQLALRLDGRNDIAAAAVSTGSPLSGLSYRFMRPEGQESAPEGGIYHNNVDPGYFALLRIPLVAGRTFSPTDRPGAGRVAIVNEAFVQRYWPGETGIGKRLFEGPDDNVVAYEVVGVAGNAAYRALDEEPSPVIYTAQLQLGGTWGVIYARGAGGSAAALQAIRAEARALDAGVPIQLATSLEQSLAVLLTPQRVGALAIGGFGLIGLLLALVGIYGLVAFSVAQRTREIGLRMALGARAQNVVALFVGQGAKLLVIGSTIGVLLALLAARLITSLLYGVSPADPLTFVALPTLLAITALLAIYLPARRASRIEPMSVLRSD